jgi:phosphoribosylanthranilate isomerase
VTWIKICGITNLEDALMAVDAGADALGFVFYEKSPRRIDPEVAREIAAKLPSNVERVGVFVNPSQSAIAVVEQVGLTAVQAHYGLNGGRAVARQNELTAVCRARCAKIYLALPMEQLLEAQDRIEVNFSTFFNSREGKPDIPMNTVFLDSGNAQQPGGTGKVFDWQRAAPLIEELGKRLKVVIAGGLTLSNVAEAIHTLKPWGVDVSSGVEASAGKKDPKKVRAFIAAVKKADQAE